MPLFTRKMKKANLPAINTEPCILHHDPISMDLSCLLPEFQAVFEVLPKSIEHIFSKLQSIQKNIDDEIEEIYRLFLDHEKNNEATNPFFYYLVARISDCKKLGQQKVEITNQAYELVDHYLQQVNDALKKDGMVFDEPEPSPVTTPITSEPQSRPSSPKLKDIPKKKLKRGPKKASNNIPDVVTPEPPLVSEPEQASEPEPSPESEPVPDPEVFSEPVPEPVLEPTPAPSPVYEPEAAPAHAPHNGEIADSIEPIYCVCRRPAFGEMVGCDSMNSCKYEWFHLECVGLRKAPKGSWYCDSCLKTRGKRGYKKRKRS